MSHGRDKIGDADRKKVLELLKLPETTGPSRWGLLSSKINGPMKLLRQTCISVQVRNKRSSSGPPIIQYGSTAVPGDITAFAAPQY